MTDIKKGKVREAQLAKSEYYNDAYMREDTFDSLVFQILTIYKLKPKNILEVGIGNGFVADFLKKAGYDVTTVDINPELKPDYVGGFDDLEDIFGNRTFDLVLCAEVLEHLPYEEFDRHILSLAKRSNNQLLITIPRANRIIFNIRATVRFTLKIIRITNWRPHFFYALPKKRIASMHHWEINHTPQTALKQVLNKLSAIGNVVKNDVIRRNPYHHYFIIKKDV